MTKKGIAMILCVCIMTALCACGGSGTGSAGSGAGSQAAGNGSSTAAGSETDDNAADPETHAASAQEAGTIIVGSKDFTENEIVAEIYALALEDAGFTVERRMNIASSVIHTSLVNKEVEL